MYKIERYHDISAGHRVVGHESKCRHLHGHNYRVHFTCVPVEGLDELGRVVDFSVVKDRLCMWIEECWDHKMLLWKDDPMVQAFAETSDLAMESIVIVPFNPTAENMAEYLVEIVGPIQLRQTGVVLQSVRIEETRKCSAVYTLKDATVEALEERVDYLWSKDDLD